MALTRALPCAVCFSPADPLVRNSINAGLLVLLGVTLVVLVGFAAFIARIARRSQLLDKSGANFGSDAVQAGFRDT